MRTRKNPRRAGYSQSDLEAMGREVVAVLVDAGAVTDNNAEPEHCVPVKDICAELGYCNSTFQRIKETLQEQNVPICYGRHGHYIGIPYAQALVPAKNIRRSERLRVRAVRQINAIGRSTADGAAIKQMLSQCLESGLTADRVKAIVSGGDSEPTSLQAVQLLLIAGDEA